MLKQTALGLVSSLCLIAGAAQAAPCSQDDVDPAKIDAGLEWIEDNKTYIDSVIVWHCGRTLAERYYNGYSADKRHDLQSATKTFSAILIGALVQRGAISSLDQPIGDFLPSYKHLLTGEKANITLRHLLTMTSGLRWRDFGDGNSFIRIGKAKDSVAFVLSEPLVTPPGEAFFYNTGSSHLLLAIAASIAEMAPREAAETLLFEPLGITDYAWDTLRDGREQGGWGLYLRPRDMLSVGRLLLDEGRWAGEQLLPEDFVAQATSWIKSTNFSSGYGFQMWIEEDMGTTDVAAARGWGGQDIFVLEALDMVITFNGSIRRPKDMSEDVKLLMSTYFVPAHAKAGR